MEQTEITQLILMVIRMTISISIGLFLLFSDFKKKKYLGFFFLTYGVSFSTDILGFFNFKFSESIVFSFAFLHTSLLYAYINSLLIFGKGKIQKKVVLFGIISYIVGLALSAIQSDIVYNTYINVYEYLSSIYFFFIYILCIVQIIKHDRIIKQQYSDIGNRELKHFLFLLVFIIVFVIVTSIFHSFIKEPYLTLFVMTFSCMWILGITYVSLHHLVSKNLFNAPLPTVNLKKDETKEEVKEEEERYETLFAEISNTIKANELFLNTDLTIMEVALAVNQHPKLVSKIINLNTNVNFNTFINDFRVEYAKTALKKTKYKHIKIDEIGKMSGFRSKSVFYSSFKRALKITPLQFQKA